MSIEDQLPRTWAVLQDGLAKGHHFGGQLAIYRGGENVIDDAFGTLGPGDETPMTSDHILCWRSAGKPWTAVAVMQRVVAETLSLDESAYEGFAGNAMSKVPRAIGPAPTLWHLLTHTTGWEPVDLGWPGLDSVEMLARVRKARRRDGAKPGEVAAYDPQGCWFVIGMLLTRHADKTFEFDPDVDAYPPSIVGILHEDVFVRAGVEAFVAVNDETESIRVEPLAAQWNTFRGQNADMGLTSPRALSIASPGSSCRGPVRSLAKLYDVLLGDLRGENRADAMSGDSSQPVLLPKDAIEEMTKRHREGMVDQTFRHQLDFGLGFIINSNRYGAETVPYGFGRYASENTFGHGGAQCAMGFADPEHDLAVAWVLNGLPGEPRHNQRNREINSAIYEDLGLA